MKKPTFFGIYLLIIKNNIVKHLSVTNFRVWLRKTNHDFN